MHLGLKLIQRIFFASPPARILSLSVFLCGVVLCAITSQSLWIDESNSAIRVSATHWAEFTARMTQMKGSELQMPLYMSYLWGWANRFGTSEYVLRMSNCPWFFLAAFALYYACGRQILLATTTIILLGVHPFTWYYLNEARPYIMECALAAWPIAILWRFLNAPLHRLSTREVGIFFLGIILLSGSSLLGLPFAGSLLATLFCAWWLDHNIRLRVPLRTVLYAALFFTPLLLILVAYYYWTLKQGGGPALLNSGTISSLLFSIYELLGFSGLGPGRLELRELGARALAPHLLGLLLLGFCYAALIYAYIKNVHQSFFDKLGIRCVWFLYVLLPILFITALCVATHFRVLGRHFMPFFPFIILSLGAAMSQLWNIRSTWIRPVILLLGVLLVLSSLELRLASRHSKDDNRSAATWATEGLKSHQVVWWAADPVSAKYYQVPMSEEGVISGQVIYASQKNPEELIQRGAPDLVILSKKDLFDSKGQIQDYLKKNQYILVHQAQAFTAWGRKDINP